MQCTQTLVQQVSQRGLCVCWPVVGLLFFEEQPALPVCCYHALPDLDGTHAHCHRKLERDLRRLMSLHGVQGAGCQVWELDTVSLTRVYDRRS